MSFARGKLDRRISLYKQTAIACSDRSETGATNVNKTNSLDGFTRRADCWANYQPYTRKSGTLLEGGQFSADTIGVFTIAFRTDISFSDRIVFNGHPYDILSIDVAKNSLRNELQEVIAVWRNGT